MQINNPPPTSHDEPLDLTELTPLIREELTPSRPREATVARVQFLTLCLSTLIVGWQSSGFFSMVLGFKHYGVDFLEGARIVGISQSIGIVAGALMNMTFAPILGFGKMLLVGSLAQTAACMLQSLLPIWSLFVVSYFLSGIGLVLLNTHARAFIAVKRQNDLKMGLLFITHDIGSMASLIFTPQGQGDIFLKYFSLSSLVLSFLNVIALALVFRLQTLDVCLTKGGEDLCDSEPDNLSHLDGFVRLIKMRATHILGAFFSVYMATRGLATSVIFRREWSHMGILLSVLSGAVMLGYVILIPVHRKIGEVKAAYYYTLAASMFMPVAYFVPPVAVKAIAIGLIGVIFGALSPIAMTLTGRVFPRYLVPGAIGWLAASSNLVSQGVSPWSQIIYTRYGAGSLLLSSLVGLATMALGLYHLRRSAWV